MFANHFEKPAFRPGLNIGGLMDIPTGKYEQGKHGEMILNGGLGSLTGVSSRPNNFKSAICMYMLAMVRRAFPGSYALTYDTEGTLAPYSRLATIGEHYDELRDIDWINDEQFTFTDLSRYSGDEFFKLFRDSLGVKEKESKTYLRTTPFLDINGNSKKFLYPTVGFIDSFSKFQVSAVATMYDKHAIGSGGLNMDAMANGKAKAQLFGQLPQLCAKSNTYMLLTAHVADVIEMDPYAADKRKLSGQKKGTTIAGVSNGFYSLPNNVWEILSNKPLLNKDKMPQYPLDNATAIQGDSDLRCLEIKNLRGKNGISDLPFNILVAQSEGIKPALSEFDYCKEADWGIGGNLMNYFVELVPDLKLSRTTVRKKLEESAALRRAVEIQSEMLQLMVFQRWVLEPTSGPTDNPEEVCTPKALYEDLKAMGYDWDVILNKTRGYWMCEEDEHLVEKKFLSTYDLMRMRKGLYKPYWMTDAEKAAITPLALAKGTAAPAKAA